MSIRGERNLKKVGTNRPEKSPLVDEGQLARIFDTRVAGEVSRRRPGCGENAPTDVGGYAVLRKPNRGPADDLRAGLRSPNPVRITNRKTYMKRTLIPPNQLQSRRAPPIPRWRPNSHPPNRWGLACLCAVLATALLTSPAWAQNQPPVANAGADRNAYTGQSITLNGSASDPDGDAINFYNWDAVVTPANANWSLAPSDVPSPNFAANTPGDYVVSLMVLDSRGSLSAPDYATIHVATNLAPVAIVTASPTMPPVKSNGFKTGSQEEDLLPLVFLRRIR